MSQNIEIIPKKSKKVERKFKERLDDYLEVWIKHSDGENVEGLDPLPEIPDEVWNWDAEENNMVIFPRTLSSKERSIVHNLASKLNISHVSVGEGDKRCIALSKDGDFTPLYIQLGIDPNTSVPTSTDCQWYDNTVVKPTHTKPVYFTLQADELLRKQDIMKQCSKLGYHIDIKVKLFDEFYVHKSYLNNETKGSEPETDLSHYWPINIENCYNNFGKESELFKGSVYFVDTIEKLKQVAEILQKTSIIGFDCEMHSFRSYYPITCLIQISTPLAVYIIDTLALWSSIGPFLGPIFENPKIVKIGHAISSMDVPCLFRDFGIIIISGFDTQEASALIGSKQQGLTKVLEKWKCPAITKITENKYLMKSCDWRIRPLTHDMLIYAATDVHYLIPTYFLFTNELIKMMSTSKHTSEHVIKKLLSFQKKCQKSTDDVSKEMYKENSSQINKNIKIKPATNSSNVKAVNINTNFTHQHKKESSISSTQSNNNNNNSINNNTTIVVNEDEDEDGVLVFNDTSNNSSFSNTHYNEFYHPAAAAEADSDHDEGDDEHLYDDPGNNNNNKALYIYSILLLYV